MAREDLEGQVGGGGYSDFEFVITDAWFGPSEAFTAKTGLDTIFMHWIGTTTLDGVPTLDAEGFHPSFALNDKWIVTDEGKSVRWDGGGGKQMFGKWYGRLMTEIVGPMLATLPDGQHPFEGDKHPRDAVNWIGTKWYMEDTFFEFSKDNPNMSDSNKLIPTSYLGRGVVANTPAPIAAAAPVAPAAPTAPAAGVPVGNNGGLRASAAALAPAMDDYVAWSATVTNLPGVAQDQVLLAEIADQSENGLYAQSRA